MVIFHSFLYVYQKVTQWVTQPLGFPRNPMAPSRTTWRPSPRLGVAATGAEAQQAGDALPPETMAFFWVGSGNSWVQ